uniref:PP2C family protein-serine/threonine phosphatase n=1 Tax=uncultured Erythrobacter sp. TaxID=263913 RepID=UPI0026138C83|nr:PP2C family serine/threonine-protein phosphatase [uncultured Erythrobacter sp.]
MSDFDLSKRLYHLFCASPNSRQISQAYEDVALGTSIGSYRDENQDRCVFVEVHFPNGSRPPVRLGIICDGMGGLEEGGIAASIALSSFISSFVLSSAGDYRRRLSDAISAANQDVADNSNVDRGTTLTALMIDGRGDAWMAHAGDSRLYQLDDNRDLALRSTDDTVSGAIRAHRGEENEDNLDNQLLQFVGIGQELQPHINQLPKQSDTRWLLTSDGAHSIGKQNLLTVIDGGKSHIDVVRKILFMSDALDARDNASALFMNGFSSFPKDKSSSGLNILVVTPSERMEFWISADPAQPEKKSSPKRSRQQSKPKAQNAPRQKAEGDDEKRGKSRPKGPQLDISFDEERSGNAD